MMPHDNMKDRLSTVFRKRTMKQRSLHIRTILFTLAVIFSVTSCYDYDDNRDICDYKVQIRYGYNMENSTEVNMIGQFVSTIDEYIFDGQGILYAVNRIIPDPCGDGMKSELDLPPGRYSVISWGNLGTTCRVNDARVGVATREDMLLALDNPCTIYPGYQNNSDRLYYGYRTFTVESKGISRIRVDMIHSHLVLKYKITWRNTQPANLGEYQMRMRGNPSEYAFKTEYISRNDQCREHDPDTDDEYLKICSETIHYIPSVLRTNVLHHRFNSIIDVDKKIEGEIVGFRLRNGTPTILSFYEITGTRSFTERKAMNDVDLNSYFTHHGIDLDRTLKQEYSLEFIIEDDGTVTVLPLNLSDWTDGGSL